MSLSIEDHIAASGDRTFQAAGSFDERVGGVADDPDVMSRIMDDNLVVRRPNVVMRIDPEVPAEADHSVPTTVEPLGRGAVALTERFVPPGHVQA